MICRPDKFATSVLDAYELGKAAFANHQPRDAPPEVVAKGYEPFRAWFCGYDNARSDALAVKK